MFKGTLLAVTILTAGSVQAAAINKGDSLLFTGAHAQEIRRFIQAQPMRTQNFIKKVGQITIEGKNVRLKAADLGLLTGPNDARLNQLGNAFGEDRAGNHYIRGTLAAYLVDGRGINLFECNSIQNPGAVGFPGVTTSACLVK
ncbi:MAG: hypothetical protein AB7H97_17980 [Pseudobdellovibrionaceae bacterium]